MVNINFAQALWLFWNICWHSLWVLAGAITLTSLFEFFFKIRKPKKDSFLFDFQQDFNRKTFPALVVLLITARFFSPTFVAVFVLALLLLRALLWLYELIRSSLQATEKDLYSTLLAHKPSLRPQSKSKFFSTKGWKGLAQKQIKLFNKTKVSYFGGLAFVFLAGLLPATFLTRFISYSPNLLFASLQNILFGAILGVVFPFSFLAKIPLAVYLSDLGLSFVGVFSFFAASLIFAWLKRFFEQYPLKQALTFGIYLIFGFAVVGLLTQIIFSFLPWPKPLRIRTLDQKIAFNLDFFLNCLSIIGAIVVLISAKKSKKLDFFNQVNKIMAKIKKPRR